MYSYKIYNCNDACQLFVYDKIMIASSAPPGARTYDVGETFETIAGAVSEITDNIEYFTRC